VVYYVKVDLTFVNIASQQVTSSLNSDYNSSRWYFSCDMCVLL